MSGNAILFPNRWQIEAAEARRRGFKPLTNEYWAAVDAANQRVQITNETLVEETVSLECPVKGDVCFIDEAMQYSDVDRYPFDVIAKVANCTGKCALAEAGLQFAAQKGSE